MLTSHPPISSRVGDRYQGCGPFRRVPSSEGGGRVKVKTADNPSPMQRFLRGYSCKTSCGLTCKAVMTLNLRPHRSPTVLRYSVLDRPRSPRVPIRSLPDPRLERSESASRAQRPQRASVPRRSRLASPGYPNRRSGCPSWRQDSCSAQRPMSAPVLMVGG